MGLHLCSRTSPELSLRLHVTLATAEGSHASIYFKLLLNLHICESLYVFGSINMFRLSHRGASSKEPACQRRACKKGGFDPRAGKVPWRRAWQLTSVFLLGESHGQRSLVLLRPRDRKELDTTVQLNSNNDRSYSRRGCLWTEEAEENILTLTPLVPTPATCHPPVVLGRRSLKATCFSTPSRSFSP